MSRALTITLIVAAGIFVGVVVAVQQAKQPVILNQLADITSTLKTIEQRFNSQSNSALTGLQEKVNALEQRLSKLEGQQSMLLTAMQQGGARAPQPAAPQAAQPPSEDMNKVYDIPVEHSYVNGPKNAPITIVEFTDFQCPFCARFHGTTKEVLKAYPKEVKYILKNFPLSFHPNAKPAAKAALAAGEQGKYYEMADMLLENNTALSEDNFKEYAKKIGLNVDRFMKDLKEKDAQWESIFQKDMALGGQVAVQGTPTFFLNGKKTNARDISGWKAQIDALLQK